MEEIRIPVTIGGVTFKNPFYVASGPTTKTVRQLQRIEETGWAAASIKLSIDPAPYINRKPRYGLFQETNALAFTAEKRLTFQEGLTLVRDAKKVLHDLILMANITYAGDKGVEGWVNMARQFEAAGADIIELNMCCPNMSYNVSLSSGGEACTAQQTGASLGQQAGAVSEIVRAIKREIGIPLFVKLTPEGGQVAQVAAALYEAGADAVGSTGNRLGIPPINLDDPGKACYHLQDEISMSCYCGPWLKPLAQRDTYEIRKVCGAGRPIMAAGGITDWKDAAEMVLCGGTLLGVCSETLIRGYDIVRPMISGLKSYMDSHGYASIEDFCGLVEPELKTAPELTLYDGYAHIKEPRLSGPCKAACPHHVPVQAYVQSIAKGDLRHAFDLITGKGVLQGACAYVCPHPCEDACVRGRNGRPIAIRQLKQFVLDWGRQQGWQPAAAAAPSNGMHVAVVGSGPAELTCADELRRAGYSVTVLEPSDGLGGDLGTLVRAGRLPRIALDELLERLRQSGITIQSGAPDPDDADFDAVLRRQSEAETVAFPNCPVMESIRPLSPQTLCGTAVILGPLAAAVDTAVCALAQGARRAVVVCPSANVRQKFVREQMELAKEHGIEILTDVVPVEAVPGGLLLHGRASIQMTLPCDSIWSALPVQSVIAAVAAGRRDAVELDRRLRGDNAVLEPTPAAIPVSADKVLARTGYYRDQMQEPVLNTLEDAVAEASRCLNCGCGEGCQLCKTICTDFAPYVSDTDEMAIDRSQCVACGMCFNRCPNGNIEMCSTGRKI
ncbi:MAG TPA: NAD(P)-binding protein [Candidatus Flavonifractor merdavium]|nr:NAD(P)-binding protein [Candidatus Flavonifractor merdavium]